MSDEDYIEPRIVESSAVCEALSRLPRLPVRVLVLAHDSVDQEREGRTVVQRALRTANDLGVGEAVVVEHRLWLRWGVLETDPPTARYDIVVFRADGLPPSIDDPKAPDPRCAAVLLGVLSRVAARFWTFDQEVFPEIEEEQDYRGQALCMQVLAEGGPPSVRLPLGWDGSARDDFLVTLFEHALHDAPLPSATDRAWDRSLPPPELFLPEGRRHGLDLARLLEDHRSRIQDLTTALRIFQREVEATRPEDAEGAERWGGVRDGVGARQDTLAVIRDSCEEIDRDRDPAGWSRLAANIDALRRLEDAVQGDRDRLAAIVAAGDTLA